MIDPGRPLALLDRILEQYRVVLHGVSMYFGSVTAPDPEHLRRLKRLVRRTRTPWLSDHLCWGRVDGTHTHDLLPLLYTWEAVERTVERGRTVQDFLEIPVAVEDVFGYAAFTDSQMTEWEFLTEVMECADCGIPLDVKNIYVSAMNHEFEPMDYVNAVPSHRVALADLAQSPLLLAIRLYWGWQFAQDGWGKLTHLDRVTQFFASLSLPAPGLTALLVALVEFAGGILFACGIASRLVSLVLFVNMTMAYLSAPDDRINFTHILSNPSDFFGATPYTYWFAALLILAFGPGLFAVDTLIGRWFEKKYKV